MSDSQSNISMPSGNYMVSNSAGKNAGSYIDGDFDPSSWKEVEAYTEELLNREISCSKCLEGIIRDASELSEHISEKGALLYIGMTCDTENEEKKGAFPVSYTHLTLPTIALV